MRRVSASLIYYSYPSAARVFYDELARVPRPRLNDRLPPTLVIFDHKLRGVSRSRLDDAQSSAVWRHKAPIGKFIQEVGLGCTSRGGSDD